MRLLSPRSALRAALTAALLVTIVPTTVEILPAHGSGVVPLMGSAGPLVPPAAALTPHGVLGSGQRSLGLTEVPASIRRQARKNTVQSTSLPATADISQYNPPVGDQGGVGSCAAWATGYYLRGWYAMRDHYYPPAGNGRAAGFAAMYLYSQSSGGSDSGSSLEGNLTIEQQQGIDSNSDYFQGNLTYISTAPTAQEQANAAQYKIQSYSANYSSSLSIEDWIKTKIAGGDPVTVAIPVYDNFYNATSSSYYVDGIGAGHYYGGHAIFASKYDANGLWIENQWGTWWGLNGWVELSWNFVNTEMWEAVSETPIAPVVSGTATATSTAVPATSTSTAVPTATKTPTATGTATLRATLTPTMTKVANTPTATQTHAATATVTPSRTSTPTMTPTLTVTKTSIPTSSATPTRTPVLPTATPKKHGRL